MDKRNLVEGLQKAFNTDDRQRNTSDTSDVEYGRKHSVRHCHVRGGDF